MDPLITFLLFIQKILISQRIKRIFRFKNIFENFLPGQQMEIDYAEKGNQNMKLNQMIWTTPTQVPDGLSLNRVNLCCFARNFPNSLTLKLQLTGIIWNLRNNSQE